MAGKYKGETGLIVNVNEKEDTVVVFSDVTAKEMTVFTQDVVESTEVSSGQDALGSYELHDLVQLR